MNSLKMRENSLGAYHIIIELLLSVWSEFQN